MDHLAKKNEEQKSLQDQQIFYVNNAANAKRRGFSAVLGGSQMKNNKDYF